MNNIYDNGEMILGKATDIMNYWKKQNNDDELLEEIITDLKDLMEGNEDIIVAINYDHGMGYSIDYWDENDILKDV